MLTFIAGRAASTLTLVAAISFITFAAGAWAPGTYEQALRLEPGYSASAAAAVRERHRLDLPLAVRFTEWVKAAARGDLGVSIEYETPVAPLVLLRASRTLLLALVAAAAAWMVAIPIGVLTAARPDGWCDRWVRRGLAALLALPEPALAIGFVMVAAQTAWLPAGGMLSARADVDRSAVAAGADLARHLVLPAGVLALGLLPVVARHVRSSVARVLAAPFILAARARGVPARRLLLRGALRAAAPPLASLLGLSVASLISASLVVEVITGWPGLGPLLVEATRSRDLPVVLGATLCSLVLLSLGTAAAEAAARLVDPCSRPSPGVSDA